MNDACYLYTHVVANGNFLVDLLVLLQMLALKLLQICLNIMDWL